MRWRAAVGLAGLAVLLAVAAPCSVRPVADPAGRPEAQVQIDRIVAKIAAANRGEPDATIPEMAEQLLGAMRGDREALLRQILVYLAVPGGGDRSMSVALLIESFGFTDQEKVAALAPYLDTQDATLQELMGEMLRTVDRPRGGPPDFSHYEPLLALLGEQERLPVGLLRYLYAVSPMDALRATARACTGRDAAAEAVHRAETLGLDELSRDTDRWVRLFAAHAARTGSGPAASEVLLRLRSDSDDLVREFAEN